MKSAARPLTLNRVLNDTPVAVGIYLFVVGISCWLYYSGAQQMGYNWQWY